MKQSALRLAMWEHSYTAHNGLDGVRIDDTLLNTGDEEGCLATSEVVVEVDEEREEGRLACVRGRRVVLIGISRGMDA
jgi:hypothetical protein